MAMPAMTLTSTTATGDLLTGPGCPRVLVKGLPVAQMTSMVAGAACVSGVVTTTVSANHIAGGLPVASLTAMVTGVTPVGAPISTACAITTGMNDLL